MKLTKFGHACFILEDQGQKLIIDPGAFTELPAELSSVAAVVVTHDHGDHLSTENIDKIRAASPKAEIFAADEVAAKINGAVIPEKGKPLQIGPFKLEFGGELHAEIHPDFPRIHNLTVTINSTVYYPGDSYDLPDTKPSIVMLPLNAPWAKIGETLDFIKAVPAKMFIPTHNALLSDTGLSVYHNAPQNYAEKIGAELHILKSGESIEI